MARTTLVAKANTGDGIDPLSTWELPDSSLAGAVVLTDSAGDEVVPATEATLSAASIKLDAVASEATLQAVTDMLQELAIRLSDIADSVGNLSPDASGRIRVAAETLGTLSTITTVTTVGTVTNQAQIGGYASNQQIMALTQIAEQALRQNIVIS